MPTDETLYLSLDEVCSITERLKEDFQREANQGIRKHTPEGQLQSLGALAKMEAAESFLYACKLRAGSYSPITAEDHQKPKGRRNAKPRTASRVMEMRRKVGA